MVAYVDTNMWNLPTWQTVSRCTGSITILTYFERLLWIGEHRFYFRITNRQVRSLGYSCLCWSPEQNGSFCPSKSPNLCRRVWVLFINIVFRHHGLPTTIVSDRNPHLLLNFGLHCFRRRKQRWQCPPLPTQRRMVRRNAPTESWKTSFAATLHHRPSGPHL